MLKYITLFIALINVSSFNLCSKEKNNLLFVEDCEPYHFAWVKDQSGEWVYVLNFEKAIIKTYFKNGPTSQTDNRFRLDKPPYKQTLEMPAYGIKLCSTDFSVEILKTDILCFCFSYEDKFKRAAEKYSGVCVSLMHGINKSNDKYEYSLFPAFE